MMEYSREPSRNTSYVSVNQLIQSQKYRGISAFPPYIMEEQKRQIIETGGPLSADPPGFSKLKVSHPCDPAEIEADRIAEAVINSNDYDLEQKHKEQSVIQTKVQNNTEVSANITQQLNNLGGGSPLSDEVINFFKPRFGADFSNVKIHTDSKAAGIAEAINAKAFTKGNDLVFAKRQYQPGTTEGKKLIAHELVHTLQQKNGVQRQQNQQTSITQNGITYYNTRQEAEANVPAHVSPRSCFVWNDGPAGYPWHPIPGTGCAHWVAHQMGINGNPGCYDGFAIRVAQVISGRTQYDLANAQVGDIWTNTAHDHCGIVRQINSNQAGNVMSARVEHCSSGQGGVVTSNFVTGDFYR